MNIDILRKEIEADEGVKYETYHCSEGHLTGGIGHLITEGDEEIYAGPLALLYLKNKCKSGLKKMFKLL